MNLIKMIAELREQKQVLEASILTLEQFARAQGKRRGRPPLFLSKLAGRKRKPFSAETRKKMAAAQKRRWAAVRSKKIA